MNSEEFPKLIEEVKSKVLPGYIWQKLQTHADVPCSWALLEIGCDIPTAAIFASKTFSEVSCKIFNDDFTKKINLIWSNKLEEEMEPFKEEIEQYLYLKLFAYPSRIYY